jgi:putative NADPH-quinone reductase
MAQFKIAVIVGSLRRDSFNRKIASAMAKLAPPAFSFEQLQIGGLPLYNQDDDANQAPTVKRLKEQVAAAQGLLFVTPEYNRSIPGVLKNALDHASRPYGQNAWKGKPRWRNSTSATFSLTWTSPRSASPKPSFRSKTACSTRPAVLDRPAKRSFISGWTSMSRLCNGIPRNRPGYGFPNPVRKRLSSPPMTSTL